MKKILIQGIKGCYHNIVANEYFSDIDKVKIIECNTFEELFEKQSCNPNYFSVCAIENNTVGAILPNYNLIRKNKLKIIGEIYLRIKHCIATKNKINSLEGLKKIYSHPMALLQCSNFFSENKNLVKIETVDTAKSAKYISKSKSNKKGCICSELAAQIYGLHIIKKNIQNNKTNFTRFLILSKKQKNIIKGDKGKTSICFSLHHKEGSLSQILSIFAYYNLNLTKIQSMPIPGEDWKYFFYVDLLYKKKTVFNNSINAIKPLVENLEVMGIYDIGKKII